MVQLWLPTCLCVFMSGSHSLVVKSGNRKWTVVLNIRLGLHSVNYVHVTNFTVHGLSVPVPCWYKGTGKN